MTEIKPNIAAAVGSAIAKNIPPAILAELQRAKFNTKDIVSPFFRAFLYGDVDSGKTVAAAQFAGPEKTRIIVTRQKEQTIPLKPTKVEQMGYECFHANSVELFRKAILYCEAIWPEWATIDGRTLVIDDMTNLKDMLNDDNSFNDAGMEVKDIRKVSKGSKDDLRDMIQLSALGKPMNLIIVALERSYEIGNEIRVGPDLPPGMASMLSADFEYVLNIRKVNNNKREIITETTRDAFVKKDDKGKEVPYIMSRFARHKLPSELHGKGLVKQVEEADLAKLWAKVKAGKIIG